ncbi:hypothetical protein SynMVIR181_01535 [Synechococcus sp. MVIR-18-1]|nr:hypothetical protein SynMVIR181_01535 [Synechococcus sp. MVIR-18-1]
MPLKWFIGCGHFLSPTIIDSYHYQKTHRVSLLLVTGLSGWDLVDYWSFHLVSG